MSTRWQVKVSAHSSDLQWMYVFFKSVTKALKCNSTMEQPDLSASSWWGTEPTGGCGERKKPKYLCSCVPETGKAGSPSVASQPRHQNHSSPQLQRRSRCKAFSDSLAGSRLLLDGSGGAALGQTVDGSGLSAPPPSLPEALGSPAHYSSPYPPILSAEP